MHIKIPQKLNFSIFVLVVLVNLTVLLIPLVTQNHAAIYSVLLLDILLLRLTNMHWHIIHEGIHNILHSNPQKNDLMGRILAILLFTSFNMVRFGHLFHHRVNRQTDEIDVCPSEKSKSWQGSLNYYFTILGGHYLIYIFAMTFMFFLPRKKILHIGSTVFGNQFKHDAKLQQFCSNHLKNHIEGRRLSRLRMDFLVSLSLLGAMVIIYHDFIMVLLSYFFIKAMLFSYFDNMPHYATEIYGDINAARNSYLPKPLAVLFMNFNYHKLHHELPVVSWYDLPQRFQQSNADYDDHLIRDFFDQFKGRILRTELLNPSRDR